jgi:hypothetical protein
MYTRPCPRAGSFFPLSLTSYHTHVIASRLPIIGRTFFVLGYEAIDFLILAPTSTSTSILVRSPTHALALALALAARVARAPFEFQPIPSFQRFQNRADTIRDLHDNPLPPASRSSVPPATHGASSLPSKPGSRTQHSTSVYTRSVQDNHFPRTTQPTDPIPITQFNIHNRRTAHKGLTGAGRQAETKEAIQNGVGEADM